MPSGDSGMGKTMITKRFRDQHPISSPGSRRGLFLARRTRQCLGHDHWRHHPCDWHFRHPAVWRLVLYRPLFNSVTLLVVIGIAGYAQRKRGAAHKAMPKTAAQPSK